MKAYFVTGTDTGVGKTTVSMALLAVASRRGLRAGGMKPIESGCSRTSAGELVPADALALARVSNLQLDLTKLCLYRFEESMAPGVAADDRGTVLDFARVVASYQTLLAEKPDLVLVEGAGGLLVPLGQGRTIADLASALDLPLLIVARPGLGTINHTGLTVEVARGRGLHIAGVIFSYRVPDRDPLLASNANEIERGARVPYLGCLPHVPVMQSDALADAAERALDCDVLLRTSV